MEIAIPLFDRFTALDAVGPYEVLSRLPGANVHFVAVEPGPKMTETRMLTLSADQTAPPTQPSPRATTSRIEPQHRVEVAPHAATTANASFVLTGGVFAFTLAVSGIVFAAGRRTGRRVS